MSTANKLSYLNDTKSLLRTSLNKFGSSILSTDTFRSYDTKLNDIYNKLPKVTQSGAGFTLSDVQNGQVDDFKMNGVDLEQSETPTPENPQEIKVVEGRQVITDKGKNLLKLREISGTNNGITISYDEATQVYTFNGTCTQDNTTFPLSNNEINFTNGITKSITYWVNGSCSEYCSIRHYDSSYSSSCTYSILNISSTNNKIEKTSNASFVCPARMTSIKFNNNSVANNLQIKIMVTDDENTDFEPYYEPVSYNIDLQLANIYLAKMPDTTYKNRIYKNNGNWYYEENVKKIVLDGSEEWTYWTNQELTNTILVGTKIIDNISNVDYIGMSNYFENSSTSIWTTDEQKMQINSTGENKIRFRINKTIANNYNSFKTWLSTHNVIVWYPLATSVTTQITNTTLINQLEAISVHTGTNIITLSSNNNMTPQIEITRLKELERLT